MKLDDEEKEILAAIKKGKLKRPRNYKALIKQAEQAAKNFRKDTRITIRLSSSDLRIVKQRAADEGLGNLLFQQGDASTLTDLADDRFDLVVSIFGAMFAPRPHDVAKEMVRVTRPDASAATPL